MNLVGLEINDLFLRAVRLKDDRAHLVIEQTVEIPLPSGVIREGKLKDQKGFEQALHTLLGRISSDQGWIIALPERLIFTLTKKFPNLGRENIKEAISLNLPELLPQPPDKIYWGYQEIEQNPNLKKFLLSSIAKEELDRYLESLSRVGIVPVAVEPLSFATGRFFKDAHHVLVISIDRPPAAQAGKIIVDLTLVDQNSPRLVREFECLNDADLKKILSHEIKKTLNFYFANLYDEKISTVILDGNYVDEEIIRIISEELEQKPKTMRELYPELAKSVPKLSLVGLGLRGALKPNQDRGLSLLPVTSQEADEEKNTINLYRGIGNVLAVTAFLFALLFGGAGYFINYLDNQAETQLAANLTSSQTNTDLSKKLAAINQKLALEANLNDKMVTFSPILQFISAQVTSEINLQQISYAQEGDPIILTGIANDQASLESFIGRLQNDWFTAIKIPTTNMVEDKVNFVINLTLAQAALENKNE